MEPTAERLQTDDSLRVERERADRSLAEDRNAVDEIAAAVISKARARADEVLLATRANADLLSPQTPLATRVPVALQRLQQDRVLRKERADADELVREESAAQASVLLSEREETDRDLLSERAQSDASLATRDEFLGVVSHDLRSMLHSVLGYGELIEEEVLGANRAQQVLGYIQNIQRSGTYMNRLIGDLLDVVSIRAGRFALTCVSSDLARVVNEAVDAFQVEASTRGIALVTEISTPLPPAAADPARIFQVLINLLSNAIKFTPTGGTVVVCVEHDQHALRFAVRDTGVGVPSAELESIFERFVQGSNRRRHGVGLGLYISSCIVHAHDGRIWAESQVGAGSVFTFTLPLAQA